MRAAGPRRDADPAERALLAALSDPAAAARIGQRLALKESDTAARLFVELGPAAPAMSVQTLRAGLAQQMARDYATARTVKLDGWLLTMTEARLCALAARHAKFGA